MADQKAFHRDCILQAAREIFFRDGFVDASLDTIAKRAGVAKGTLYLHFKSKGALYVEILREPGGAFEDRLRELAEGDRPPHETLREMARFYLEYWTERPDYFRIFWALGNEPVIGELSPDQVERVTKRWRTCLGYVANVVERGIQDGSFAPCDPEEAAHLLWTLGHGLLESERVPALRLLRPGSLENTLPAAIDLMVKGLRPR